MIRFLQTSAASKALLAVVIGVVCVGMVLYLGQAFMGDGVVNETGVYAKVGDQEVTSTEVGAAARRQSRQMFPNGAPEQFLPYLNRRAADQLVTQAAMINAARKMGLRVSDEELSEELHKGGFGQQLFPNGQFVGQEQYTNFIADNFQMSVADFEHLLKEDLLLRKLEAVVSGSVTVSPEELQAEFLKQNTKVKFDYAVITTADLVKQVNVTDAELQAYYENHKAQLKDSIPEQRKARFVVIDPAKVPVQVSDDDIKNAYEQRKAAFQQPEQVDVRHILISTQGGKHTDADALKLAKDIQSQLKSGADFAALAKKYSEDPGSKDNGGLYKDVVRGQMVKEFNDAAFSLKPGQISDPIKTAFGYHVLKVDAHREARSKPLEEVRPEVEAAVKTEKGAREIEKIADQVTAEARTEGMDKAAAKHGLNVITTDYFTQTSALPGIGESKDFMQQVYTFRPKSPAEKVRLENGFAVVEVLDSKPARTPEFSEVRAKLETQYKNEKAQQLLAKKTQELADRAHALKNLRAAAKEVGATVKTSDLVAPSSQVPDLGAMSGDASVAFTLNQGDISGPIQAGANGAVLQMEEKQQPAPSELAAKQDQLREQLIGQKRGQVLQVFAESVTDKMRKDGAIRINDKVARQLFGPAA